MASAWLVLSAPAAAHSPGLSVGDYAWRPEDLQVTLSIARADLANSWPRAITGDGSWLALVQHEALAKTWVRERLSVRSDERACTAGEGTLRLDGDGVIFELAYDCPDNGGELAITAAFLRDFSANHRHLLQLRLPDRSVDRVLSSEDPSLVVPLRRRGRGRAQLVWLIAAAAGAGACLYLVHWARTRRT